MKQMLISVMVLGSLLMVGASEAVAQSDSEIWDLSASGHVYFDNARLASEIYGLNQEYDFDMGAPNINVSMTRNGNSWTIISANGFDPNVNSYILDGNSGLFSISGLGITPGFGPVTTDYTTAIFAVDALSGSFSGFKTWNNFPGPNGLYNGTAQWSGTFEVARGVAPEPVSSALFLLGGIVFAARRVLSARSMASKT